MTARPIDGKYRTRSANKKPTVKNRLDAGRKVMMLNAMNCVKENNKKLV